MPVLEEPSNVGNPELAEPGATRFDEFFRTEYPAMVALAAVVSRSPHLAEDIAQEAMLRARRHWDRISGYDKPGTWVRRVTINLSLNSRRGLAREARTRLAWWQRREAAEHPEALDTELLGALHALSPHQLAAVSLHYLEDRSTAEIADLIGCSEATVRVHLHRGRQALAKRLGGPR
jgi:RNA polymerase sigma-70 factor, ECF subfamily